MPVKLSPSGRRQYMIAGEPANGYKLFYFAAGSTTKQNTYTTSVGNVPNENPLTLDSSGRTPFGVWFTAGLGYKEYLAIPTSADPPTSAVLSEDNLFGINDTSVSTSQWTASGLTPTYVSTTQFTLVGDQTTDFHVGRRVRFTVTAGTVYGKITVSAYTTLTTITIDSGPLDAGLSAVDLSILTYVNNALPTIDPLPVTLATVSGTANAIALTPSPAISAYASGQQFIFIATANNTAATTVAVSGLVAKSLTQNGSTALVAGNILSGALVTILYDGTRFQLMTSVFAGSASQNFAMNAGTVAGTLNVTGNVGIGTASSTRSLEVSNATIPVLAMRNTGQALDNKYWDFSVFGTELRGLVGDDANTLETNWMKVLRSGMSITSVTFPSPVSVTGAISPAAGIKFPATQNAIADVNTLDDYEEGAFTPSLLFGGAAVGMTYTQQSGTYTKKGREFTCIIAINLSAKGSSTGAATISGLPFTNNFAAPCSLRYNFVTYTGSPQAFVNGAAAVINFEQITEAGVGSLLSDANFAATSSITITVTGVVAT